MGPIWWLLAASGLDVGSESSPLTLDRSPVSPAPVPGPPPGRQREEAFYFPCMTRDRGTEQERGEEEGAHR